jgi:hypothetical protein
MSQGSFDAPDYLFQRQDYPTTHSENGNLLGLWEGMELTAKFKELSS